MSARPVVLSLLVFTSSWVMAQSPQLTPQDIEAQRVLVVAMRSSYEADFGAKEKECYQRFAVNDCLRTIRRDRRVVMDGLRKQEVALNDKERQASVLAELARIQANTGPERNAELRLQEGQALKAALERQTRMEDKQSATTQAPKTEQSPDKKVEPVSAVKIQENEKAFADKLQEAKQRRTDKATSLNNQGPSTVKPLPTPH